MSQFADDVIPIVTEVMQTLREQLIAQQKAQGHYLTGQLSDSIDFEVSPEGNDVVGRMFAEDYSGFLEFGVRADKIPFKPGGERRGGSSMYIQGLISFWEHRGLSGREAVGAAFATATVHSREGMPSRGSYRFSSTGERTGFIRTTVEQNLPDISATIERKYGAVLALNFATNLGQFDHIKFAA